MSVTETTARLVDILQ